MQQTSTSPTYLEAITNPTPLSVARLTACWGDLSVESQLDILTKHVSAYPSRYKLSICLEALKSPNFHVRYVAVDIGWNVPKIQECAKMDASKYISGANVVSLGRLNCTYEVFFNLTDCERLVNVSRMAGGADQIAGLVRHWYSNSEWTENISEDHVFDILCEYLSAPTFRSYYLRESRDGGIEASKGSEINAMWNLLTIVNKSIALLLIDKLPERSGLSNFEAELLGRIPEDYADWILSNERLVLETVRRTVFQSPAFSDRLKAAAAACNLSLSDSEFLEFMSSDKIRSQDLVNAIVFSKHTDVCIKKALIDLALEPHGDGFEVLDAKKSIIRQLSKMDARERRWQLSKIRLYNIAVWCSPWGGKRAESKGKGLNDRFGFIPEFDVDKLSKLPTWNAYVLLREMWERIFWSRGASKSDQGKLYQQLEEFKIEEETLLVSSNSIEERVEDIREMQDTLATELHSLGAIVGGKPIGERIQSIHDAMDKLAHDTSQKLDLLQEQSAAQAGALLQSTQANATSNLVRSRGQLFKYITTAFMAGFALKWIISKL